MGHANFCTITFLLLIISSVYADGPVYSHLNPNCTCIQARVDYLLRRNDVAGANIDPVFHYDAWAANEVGALFRCDLCEVDPIFINDLVARCSAAKETYAAEFKVDVEQAFDHYWNNFMLAGNVWHFEKCPGVLPQNANFPPIESVGLSYECTCLNARLDYWNRYKDVKDAQLDPLTHYVTYYNLKRNTWNCLCDSTDIFMNDTYCSTCGPALQKFSSTYKVASTAVEPFLMYWNFAWPTRVPYHCELCVQGVTTAPTIVPTPTPTPQLLTEGCKCLAARSRYYVRYPDVLGANFDGASHYDENGKKEGRLWDCSLCKNNDLYVSNFSDCAEASARYMRDYGLVANAYQSYLEGATTHDMRNWHYELCPMPIPDVPENCQCIGAYTSYYSRYPEATKFDAVYHYRWFGAELGYTWDCGTCSETSLKPKDSVCNCPEAAAHYITTTGYNGGATNAHSVMKATAQYFGNPWSCQICSTSVADPSTSLTCNCTTARNAYLNAHPTVSGDPWAHYVNIGKSEGLSWDCGICNDTCPGLYSNKVWLFDNQVSSFSAGDSVVIPTGCYYPLSSSLDLTIGNLTVSGTLRCADKGEYSITATKIWVYGSLECGTDESPFDGSISITLFGDIPAVAQTDRDGGDKSIAVFNGGKLLLHGNKLVSWTRLDQPALVGASSITVQDTVDWEVGDEIIIASTAPFFLNVNEGGIEQSEVRTIFSISGKSIGLSAPLNFGHLAESNQLTPSLTLQRRAEVGLLSGRNIRIQGDDISKTKGFGPHIMMMRGARAYASGIQITNGGQLAILARYPWHWHMLGDISYGQYIRNSSVVNSSNRCYTVHATNNTVVSGNLCYNFTGHGYFLEDGVEVNTTIDGNLGILAIRPTQPLVVSDTLQGPHSFGPAVFWLSNPNNTLTNNVAVGSVGSGFWIQPEIAPTGTSLGIAYNPQLAPFGVIKNNQAHGTMEGFTTCPIAGGSNGPQLFRESPVIDGFHVYGTSLGLWPCGSPQYYNNTIVYEAVLGMQVPSRQIFNNIAFVDPAKSYGNALTNAINLYDSGWVISNVLFKDYDSKSHHIFKPAGASQFFTNTRTYAVTLENSAYIYGDPSNVTYTSYNGEWGHLVNDMDGTLTGHAGYALTTDHPMIRNGSCIPQNPGFGYACPMRYGEIFITFNTVSLRPATIARYHLGSPSNLEAMAVGFPFAVFFFYRWTAIANSDYVYVFVMPTGQDTTFISKIQIDPFSMQGDSFAIEIRNVRSAPLSLIETPAGSSCDDVYAQKTRQSFFWDRQTQRVCIRLIASQYLSPTVKDDYGYGIFQTMTVRPSNLIENQPVISDLVGMEKSKTCVRAMTKYWITNFDVRQSGYDPVYHYTNFGKPEGRTWPADLCAEDPHFAMDQECACPAAKYAFAVENPAVSGNDIYNPGVSFDSHEYYTMYGQITGPGYHCELCTNLTNIQGPHTIPVTSRCEEARIQYKYNYNLTDSVNAVYHYQTTGGSAGNKWPSELCSTTTLPTFAARTCNCTEARTRYLSDYPADAKLWKHDPITHWRYFGDVYNMQWHCELCPTYTSPTPNPDYVIPTHSPTPTPSPTPSFTPSPSPSSSSTSSTSDKVVSEAASPATLSCLILVLVSIITLF